MKYNVILTPTDCMLSEEDFDEWVLYVSDRLDQLVAVPLDVSGCSFKSPFPMDQIISPSDTSLADDDEASLAIREGIRELWERYCSEGAT